MTSDPGMIQRENIRFFLMTAAIGFGTWLATLLIIRSLP